MDSDVSGPPIPAGPAIQAGLLWRWRRARTGDSLPLGPVFWLAAGFLVVLGILAVAAPWLPLRDPTISDLDSVAVGPSLAHWLGTDALGRDMLSRIVWGARVSLSVGLGATGLSAFVGVLIGLLSGIYQGPLSTLVMRLMDVLLAFPALVFALAVVAVVGPSITTVILVIGIVYLPAFARTTRASTLSMSQREFVIMSRALGIPKWRITLTEILPNVISVVVTLALTIFGDAVLVEGGLAFLGVSVPPPTSSWGAMIASGRARLDDAPHIALIPVAALVLVVICANGVGDILAARNDRRMAAL